MKRNTKELYENFVPLHVMLLIKMINNDFWIIFSTFFASKFYAIKSIVCFKVYCRAI